MGLFSLSFSLLMIATGILIDNVHFCSRAVVVVFVQEFHDSDKFVQM